MLAATPCLLWLVLNCVLLFGAFYSGEGFLPPAEAVELAVNYVFGKLDAVEDEEHPLESAYNVVKRSR